MNSSSPGAFALSALLHAALIGLVLFFSYAATSVVEDNPKVFELVAGAGDNYAATAAPALGSPGGIKVKALPQETPPTPPASEPAQAVPIQAAAEVPTKTATKAPAKPVDLVRELKRVEERRERRLEAQYKKQEEAEKKRISQEEFQKGQAAKAKARIDAEGIRSGVLGGSTTNKTGGAGGTALTREEGHELEAYFALLKARIKENFVPPEGVSNTLEVRLELFVAADGSVSHVHVSHSSGNPEVDRAAVEACEHIRSIGPRPDGRSDSNFVTLKVKEDE
jgi:colicin import membrane protein